MKPDQKKSELRKILEEVKSLGLTFDIGTAYISKKYIAKQNDLIQRINLFLEEDGN